MTRRIAIFTSTRADYGLLRRLIAAVDASAAAELLLIVSGSHLSKSHGSTVGEIEADGFRDVARVPIWTGDDTPLGALVDVAAATGEYGRVLSELSPDVLVVLGDRLEAFAVATAATVLGIAVAHIHGGEVTEGAMDESLRHAITKLSLLHFTSTADHRQRVIQMGEDPSRVFFLGAPFVDALSERVLMTSEQVETVHGVVLTHPLALVTFHPATRDVLPADGLLEELLAGLLLVEGLHVVITGSNTDIGSASVRSTIAAWVAEHPDRVQYVESFGQHGYLSVMALSNVVVGNSSSTVLEAPVLGIPSVLVGDRQKGRPLSAGVRTPAPERHDIAAAVSAALADGRRDPAGGIFGDPGFAERALEVLLEAHLPKPPRKGFHDIEMAEKR